MNDSHHVPIEKEHLGLKAPLLKKLILLIDSRQLFTSGFSLLLRFGAHAGLFLALVIWARGLELLSKLNSSAPSFTAALVQVLALLVLVYVWAVITVRAGKLAEKSISNVLTIALRFLALTAEVAAILALSGAALFGVAKILSGPKGEEAFGIGVVQVPNLAFEKLFSSDGGTESAVELTSRLSGVGVLLTSVFVGFAVLFTGYLLYDWSKLVYQFLLRKDEAE